MVCQSFFVAVITSFPHEGYFFYTFRTIINTNAVKYVLFANTVLILIQYFLGQMSVLRDGLVQTLTDSSPNIAQTIANASTASWPNC